jgi:hypothetical protein
MTSEIEFHNLIIYIFYRCFFRGNGGTVNVLRISGPQGYPECGTQRVSYKNNLQECIKTF